MVAAIRRQAGFFGACACGAILSTMIVLSSGSDPLSVKLAGLVHLFH